MEVLPTPFLFCPHSLRVPEELYNVILMFPKKILPWRPKKINFICFTLETILGGTRQAEKGKIGKLLAGKFLIWREIFHFR